MIELASVNAVMQRIADIEEKVGMQHKPHGGVGFQETLASEMAKGKTPSGSAASGEVTGPSSVPVGAMAGSQSAGRTPVVTTPSVSAERLPSDSAYLDTIQRVAQKYGVDPKLVSAVAEVESGFNPNAVSSAGAVGIMQLMPETAASLGVNPYDAQQNIEGGTRYLRQLMDAFPGDLRRAVAAYNAGPQTVREYGGVPPYGETQAYVDSVLDLYR